MLKTSDNILEKNHLSCFVTRMAAEIEITAIVQDAQSHQPCTLVADPIKQKRCAEIYNEIVTADTTGTHGGAEKRINSLALDDRWRLRG